MELYVRNVEEKDLELLYDWANDPVVRQSAFHTETIPFHTHQIWFQNMRKNPDIYQYILCEKETDKPVAQIRFAIEEGNALISYSVGKEYRGRGIGTTMIFMAQKKLLEDRVDVKRFVAQVKYENEASGKVFSKCGYDEEKKEEYREFTLSVNQLWIRADGNETIGLGHVMRCLSVADAAAFLGNRVVFLIADDTLAQMIMDRGYDVYILGTDYREMETELPLLEKLLGEHKGPSICLVDSYQVTSSYLEAVGKLTKVAVMDDLFSMDYPVDCVINYNIYGDLLLEKETKFPERILLTGVTYAPVREQFLRKHEEMLCVKKTEQKEMLCANAETEHEENLKKQKISGSEEKVSNILILTGGSDSLHLAKRITEYLWNQDDIPGKVCFHIVCGALNPNKEELLALEQQCRGSVKVHIDVKNMAELMEQATMAITAAGSTIYELSTLGVPFVTYSFVENQKLVAQYANEVLQVVNAGDFSKEPAEAVLEKIKLECIHLLSDENDRKKLSHHLFTLVDSKGAIRIAKELCKQSGRTE